MDGPLFQLLQKRTGSAAKAREAIDDIVYQLGMPAPTRGEEQLAGLALCARGAPLEQVSKHLTWKDFEGFCSDILQSGGYRVRENIFLRKPRAQVDLFALSGGISLAIDCKHWARAPGHGALSGLVAAQKGRARRLHDTLDGAGPIATVIVLAIDGGTRFVDGGAVVPVFALRDFLANLDSFREMLDLV